VHFGLRQRKIQRSCTIVEHKFPMASFLLSQFGYTLGMSVTHEKTMQKAFDANTAQRALQLASETLQLHRQHKIRLLDRLAVAMFHTHGTDLAKWPASVREMLGL